MQTRQSRTLAPHDLARHDRGTLAAVLSVRRRWHARRRITVSLRPVESECAPCGPRVVISPTLAPQTLHMRKDGESYERQTTVFEIHRGTVRYIISEDDAVDKRAGSDQHHRSDSVVCIKGSYPEGRASFVFLDSPHLGLDVFDEDKRAGGVWKGRLRART